MADPTKRELAMSALDSKARAKLLEVAAEIKADRITVSELRFHRDTHDFGHLYVRIGPTAKGLRAQKRRAKRG